MYVHNSRTIIVIVALVALCALAAAGLMHRSNNPASASTLAAPLDPSLNPQNPYPAPPPMYTSSSRPQSEMLESDGYYSSTQRPVSIRQSQPGAYQQQEGRQYSDVGTAYTDGRTVYSDGRTVYSDGRTVYSDGRTVYENRPATYSNERRYGTRTVYEERPVYRHGRTKTHSVEIVAGTAGVGALIGGIAGGGKGAALGAVSGAGAGFVYDRLTHNH